MSADEQLGRTGQEDRTDGAVVFAWIASDVFYQNIGPVKGKAARFGILQPDVLSVNVAVHRSEGTECLQPVDDVLRADVSGMPDFIARLEIFQVTVVPVSMCI